MSCSYAQHELQLVVIQPDAMSIAPAIARRRLATPSAAHIRALRHKESDWSIATFSAVVIIRRIYRRLAT
jgi:hypothetical protein